MVFFGVLGPLSVSSGDRIEIEVTAPRQRAALAVLLTRANKLVSRDELVDALWEGGLPQDALGALAVHVSRLRRVLGAEAGARIRTYAGGYLIEAATEEYDGSLAVDLERRAREAARHRDWPMVHTLTAEASSLWRGVPFQDVPVSRLRREDFQVLEAMRVRLTELAADADLRLGHADEAIARLTSLTSEFPLRERAYERLITVLGNHGRRAEALEVYQQARRALRERLGIDPGPGLIEAQQAVLAPVSAPGDPAAADAVTHRMLPTPRVLPVPRQLPAPPRHFVGRDEELAAMDAVIELGGAPEPLVLFGMGGIGKTALAVFWAHRVAGRFPEGQLFLNLRGFDPDGSPVTAHDACRILLGALGTAPGEIPQDPDARVALYRSVMAGRRVLLVLDNAWDAGQVRPLLPGTGAGQVVVTSRNKLLSLVAVDGAHPILMRTLNPDAAAELLIRRAGNVHTPGSVDDLALACAGLPLALTIVAARLRLDPGRSPAQLAAQLRADLAASARADPADAAVNLHSVFSLSYHRLSPPAAAVFRLLGLHPGPDLTPRAAAALSGEHGPHTAAALAELVRASLLADVSGRLQFHDLIREYARTAAGEDDPGDRAEALRRMFDYYLHSAVASARSTHPWRLALELAEPAPGSAPESFADADAARAWIEAEEAVVRAVFDLAVEHGADDVAQKLPWTLVPLLDRRGDWAGLATLHARAAEAAERTGDLALRARTHADTGAFLIRTGAHAEALEHLARARVLWRELGDLPGQTRVELSIGMMHHDQGEHALASAHTLAALALARQAGRDADVALAAVCAAWSLSHSGELERAAALADEAIELHRRVGNGTGEAHAWDAVGLIRFRLGHATAALDAYRRALTLFGRLGERHYQAKVLTRVAEVEESQQHPEEARTSREQALALFETLGSAEAEEIRVKLADTASRQADGRTDLKIEIG